MKIASTQAAVPVRQLLISAAVALAASLAMPTAASANPDDVVTCSARTLRGVYEFSASGFNIVNGVALPKAIIETVVFDGRGNVSTPAVSVAVNGNFIRPPQGSPGVYTVSANCTGTLTFADGPMFDLHVAPSGKSLKMLQTNPNTVMQGTALKILPLSAWGG
jgi:hypothetical protein